MKIYDKLLFEQSSALDSVLEMVKNDNRNVISQLSLLTLRHFVEHVMLKIYCDDKNVELNDDWNNLKAAYSYIYANNKYSFIGNFHRDHLQKTVSHKIESLEYSETLMISYYSSLLSIKDYILRRYGIELIKNLDKYPLDLDNTFLNYYKSIQKVVFMDHLLEKAENGYYYVFKKKAIWVDKRLMYELTLGLANDYADKQDRFIAFSSFDIFDNYAIEAFIVEDKINYFNSSIAVKCIVDYNVSIRTYELNNIGKILGCNELVRKKQKEFAFMMQFIKQNFVSLDKIVSSSKEYFDKLCIYLNSNFENETPILNILIKAREIICNNKKGSNVLRYLLCNARNSTIIAQLSNEKDVDISNLRLKKGVLPFDETPFAANLIRSKQSLSSVYRCIKAENVDSQLLANKVGKLSDSTGQLYVDFNNAQSNKDINSLLEEYNSLIPDFQKGRRLGVLNKYVFINENQTNSVRIIRKLIDKTRVGVTGYSNQALRWLSLNNDNVKGEEKKRLLPNIFNKSKVFILYGSAGTGKSTTISFILKILGNVKKLCLAPTHPAIDNMKRKVNDPTADYYTIRKFITNEDISNEWDIVVIDECSIVSNRDMIKVLEKLSYGALLLTGDIFQLPSIEFGNWFHIAKSLLPDYATFELTEQFRTSDERLLKLWEKVRTFDNGIYEYLSHNRMTKILDETVFDKNGDEDQIILCYNYDGLYGINSINRYLQSKNKNEEVHWNQYIYKVGDPVIFHNSKIYSTILHNNLKGKIQKIEKTDDKITFDLAVDASYNEMNFKYTNLRYVESLDNGWTVIRLTVYRYDDEEESDEPREIHTVPFQVSYAISIHKSQGLEYDSVKIIIANNVEELISHNVFYTAITRAKKNLMIYWTPETAAKILSNFKSHFDETDSSIIRNKFFKLN